MLPSLTAAAASCTRLTSADPEVKLTAEKTLTAASNKESGRLKLLVQDAVIQHSNAGPRKRKCSRLVCEQTLSKLVQMHGGGCKELDSVRVGVGGEETFICTF